MIKTAAVGDIKMDYAVFGDGKTPLVIIPGLSLGSVTPSADLVEARYKEGRGEFVFYLFDRRKDAPKGYSIQDMAEDTAAVMNAIKIEKACIYGASQGGMIAQCIAANYPESVKKLALCSTFARSNPTADKVIGRWITLAENGDIKELIPDMIDKIYSQNTLDKYRDLLINSFSDISDYELKQFVIMAKAADGFSSFDKIDKIKCPVTVFGSLGDNVTTADGSRELAKALDCDIYLYDKTYGHGVYDEADDFPHRLFSFFNS